MGAGGGTRDARQKKKRAGRQEGSSADWKAGNAKQQRAREGGKELRKKGKGRRERAGGGKGCVI